MINELDAELYKKLKMLCSSGDALVDEGKHEEALELYKDAWKLIPNPQKDWEASTWVLAALGDTFFQIKDFESSREALEYAMICPNALGNPFMHLRFGQVLLELNELDSSADELTRAYMGAGKEIFETEDPKYYQFLKTYIDIE